MTAQEIRFAIQTSGGAVSKIGKSFALHPMVRRNGGGIKWYEDKVKSSDARKGGAV